MTDTLYAVDASESSHSECPPIEDSLLCAAYMNKVLTSVKSTCPAGFYFYDYTVIGSGMATQAL